SEALRRREFPDRNRGQTPADPAREAELADLRDVLAAELGRLPEKYRLAIELCHLQGLTHEAAAQRLGWPVGTVRSRPSGGRARLRRRLATRGLGTSAAVLETAFRGEMQAAVPGALLRSTAHAATITAAGGAGAFPASVAALASGTVHAMILSKLKLAATVAA